MSSKTKRPGVGTLLPSLHCASNITHRSVQIRETHFDEENLSLTQPKTKDYGLILITESKTPFPRKAKPVDAAILRQRLLTQLFNKNAKTPSLNSLDVSNIQPVPLVDSSTTLTVNQSFQEQRRRFYADEFTITRQKDLRWVIHPAAEAIQDDLTRASVFSVRSQESSK